ncbi:MAG: hypothetical protein IME93_00315 [Proteobacteria bacterium]|nr:hypothetical protein [Pseudomonadota bacterium]
MPLITRFINLCLLQVGPQHVPASSFLLVLCSAAYVITGTIGSSHYYSWPLAAQTTMADAVLLVIFTNAALAIRGLPQRSTQTMIALMGVGIFFHVIVLLVVTIGAPTALLLILLLWNAVVIAHILRAALNIPLMFGFGLTAFYIFVSVGVTVAITADKVG